MHGDGLRSPAVQREEMNKCRVCDKEWHGLAECHCSKCHEHFKSIAGFDKHRLTEKGNRRCLSIEEMFSKKMVFDEEKKFWVTGKMPEGLRYGKEQPILA